MSDPPSASDFVPISPNPFIVGNPVRDRAMFFGREAEFELVRKRFQDSDRGGLLVFCGERRSGKTSVLFQILDRRLGPAFIPVLIDMQSMAVGNELEFLSRVSEEVLGALGPEAHDITVPDFAAESNRSATFQKFVREVLRKHPDRKLILLFDEYELFENKIDSGQLDEDVLHILANLIETQPVFLIFTGSQHLDQRRHDYWKILGKSLYKRISFLEREDALNLIRRPVEGRVTFGDGATEMIYRLTSGQPFYTQAICQSLVDHLNENHTNHVTPEAVAEVVNGIVNNPLPQMIFHWDGQERDEKLVLALLAECLPDADARAPVDQITRLLRQRGYPLELGRARISTVLEQLFRTEMLERDDRTSPAGYAFRMDLWRGWIRRQHSVWQVMREEGLELRPALGGRRGRRALWIAGGMAGMLVALVVLRLTILRPPRSPAAGVDLPAPGAPTALFALRAQPEHAIIHLDGQRMGMGTFDGAVLAGREHRFRITAAGHADSELVVNLPAGRRSDRLVALRPLLGDLHIETQPPGAEILVDGSTAGRSPVTIRGLAVPSPHRVSIKLAGHAAIEREVSVQPGANRQLVRLTASRAALLITTDPSGCEIRVDGVARGISPVRLAEVALGRHGLSASREGFVTAETSLVVSEDARQVHIALVREPPGILVVQGDRPGQIYIDGVLVVENVQNSGPRPLPPGTHQVRVILVSGETIDRSVSVHAGERVILDYTTGALSRRPEGER